MKVETALAEVISFITEELLDGEDIGLADDTPILEYGLINSLALVKLRARVSARLGIELPPEALSPATLATPRAIAELIAQRAGA